VGSSSEVSEKVSPARSARGGLAGPQFKTVALGLVLMAATFALYWPVHNYAFIDIDDERYVTANPHIQGILGWSTVKWAFLHAYAYNWHPLTWLSHALDIQLFEMQAGYHHEVNVILHALDAAVLFWVLKRATGFTGRSFMVAALFAVHPINVESVAWVAERKTMLSTLFFFLTLGVYRWYARDPRLRRMVAVAFLYGLGLLSKPQVITLPFVLLLWDYWPLGRMLANQPNSSPGTDVFSARSLAALVKEKIPLFFICIVDAILTMVAQHAGTGSAGVYTFFIRLENAAVSYAKYVGKALWPSNLALMYLHPGYTIRWWQFVPALLLLIAISAWVYLERRHRYLVVGWLWFIGTLVPMIGIVQTDVQALADRYAYVSFVGLFLMVCWGLAEWAGTRHVPRAVLPVSSAVVLLVLSGVTHRQMGYWSDRITLWTHTLEVTHRNWVADSRLGTALRLQGQPDEALMHLYRAAEDRPREIGVNFGIAVIEQQRGNLQQAAQYYEKVLAVSQDEKANAVVLNNLGQVYSEMGDTERARECFAVAARPAAGFDWQADWWNHLGPMIRQYFDSWKSRSNRPSQ